MDFKLAAVSVKWSIKDFTCKYNLVWNESEFDVSHLERTYIAGGLVRTSSEGIEEGNAHSDKIAIYYVIYQSFCWKL